MKTMAKKKSSRAMPGKKMAMKGPDAMKKNAKAPVAMQGVKTQRHDMAEIRAGQGATKGPKMKQPPSEMQNQDLMRRKVMKGKRPRNKGRS
jgi:hypothetical protein